MAACLIRPPVLMALAALMLAGCSTEGDFGRRAPAPLLDSGAAMAGDALARGRGEPVSGFARTDDEREYRNRAWLLLMPAHPAAQFDRILTEFKITRVLPSTVLPPAPSVYHDALMAESWRSSTPPYRRLINDMQADIEVLDPLDHVAARVAQTDRIRAAALTRISDLKPDEIEEAEARIAENRALDAWIDRALALRVEAYEYALRRLVIEIPEREAVAAERMLSVLKERIAARAVAAGGWNALPGSPAKERRYTPLPDDATVVRK